MIDLFLQTYLLFKYFSFFIFHLRFISVVVRILTYTLSFMAILNQLCAQNHTSISPAPSQGLLVGYSLTGWIFNICFINFCLDDYCLPFSFPNNDANHCL